MPFLWLFRKERGRNAPYVCESDAILRHFGILSITESNVEKPEHKKMPEKIHFPIDTLGKSRYNPINLEKRWAMKMRNRISGRLCICWHCCSAGAADISRGELTYIS